MVLRIKSKFKFIKFFKNKDFKIILFTMLVMVRVIFDLIQNLLEIYRNFLRNYLLLKSNKSYCELFSLLIIF